MRDAWRSYWFEFEVLRRRMVLWRVFFFGLLAADFWLILLQHAPRLGAAGFNVSQFPALDPYLPIPTPGVVGPLYLLGGFLSSAIALGIAPRRCLFVLAPLYAGVYFWSQADSYQHHYLISLLLILLTFVPDEAWTPPEPGEPTHVRSWALRLVYVQIGLMYAWTAVAKNSAVWLDGTTLDQLLACEPREQLRGLATAVGGSLQSLVALAATAVVVGESVAGLVYLARPLWSVGFVSLPIFHVGVEWLRLDIELFSFYMVATNLVLLMPERWASRLGASVEAASRAARRRWPAWAVVRDPAPGPAWVAVAGAVAVVFVAGLTVPYVGAQMAGGVLAVVSVWILWPRGAATRRTCLDAAGLAAAGLALALVAHFSDTAYTYYRQWGGSLRRLGDDAGAAEMYTRANAVAGDGPARHLALARLVAARGDAPAAVALVDEELRRLRTALDGPDARPTDAEGWLDRGRTARAEAEALEFARGLWPGAGREAEVAGLSARRNESLRIAREAFQKNVELSPACGPGRTELSRLAGGRGGESQGEP